MNTAMIIRYAEEAGIAALHASGQRIEMSAKLITPVNSARRDSAAGGRRVSFVAKSRKGRKTKPRYVAFSRKADFREIRYPGQLRDSIRIVEKDGRKLNLRVVMGHYHAYYAPFVERGTIKMSPRSIMKQATSVNRGYARKQMKQAMVTACSRANQLTGRR